MDSRALTSRNDECLFSIDVFSRGPGGVFVNEVGCVFFVRLLKAESPRQINLKISSTNNLARMDAFGEEDVLNHDSFMEAARIMAVQRVFVCVIMRDIRIRDLQITRGSGLYWRRAGCSELTDIAHHTIGTWSNSAQGGPGLRSPCQRDRDVEMGRVDRLASDSVNTVLLH